jgi:iron complex outermembrane receptor protein
VAGIPTRLNFAIYQEWIDDVQRAQFVVDPRVGSQSGFTANIPRAQVRGFEIDSQINPLPWLELGLSASYTDGKFTKDTALLFGQTTVYGPYSDAPRWSGSAFAQVRKTLPNSIGELSVRGELIEQSKFYFGSLNNTTVPGTEIPGYAVSNFRVGLDDIGGSRLAISANVKNAFNRTYWLGGIPAGELWGQNVGSPAEPRTFYMEARYRF